MKVTDRGGAPPPVIQEIEAAVATLKLLEDVVRWGAAQSPSRMITDVVVQDEYTHDVVIAYDDAWFLVFDTT